MPIESAKKAWNTKIKATLKYPSVIGTGTTANYIMSVIEAIEINGVGHPHELRHGTASHAQIMVTRKNDGQTGRIIVAETEPSAAMLLWLARNDVFFDIVLAELPTDQNEGFGQWILEQAQLVGCKVDPMDFRYDGDLPYITSPFTWMRYYDAQGKQIGDALFVLDEDSLPQGNDT
ncbi:MAG: hypothetical protein BV459_01940 [Thermoplasmata archaeon M11B2D]|nr:MAG: hypothetical protein BV459_01940 [Thermoplasmata archaeon M11B2D]